MLEFDTIGMCGPAFWTEYLLVMSNFLLILNAASNFFIYFFTGKKFRKSFIRQQSK